MLGPGCLVCPWAAARPRAVRAASFARRVVSKPGQAPPPPTCTADRLCSPRSGLQSGGARHAPARPRRRPRAPQPGPLGLVMTGYSTMSHVIPLRVFHTLKLHRWNCNVLRGARILTVGNYVRLLFWLTSWPRRTDNETPLNNDAVRGLALTVIRSPSASSLPGRRTRRSLPRRRWGGSNRADLLEAGSP